VALRASNTRVVKPSIGAYPFCKAIKALANPCALILSLSRTAFNPLQLLANSSTLSLLISPFFSIKSSKLSEISSYSEEVKKV